MIGMHYELWIKPEKKDILLPFRLYVSIDKNNVQLIKFCVI